MAQTFPAHYKAYTVNRVWSTLSSVRWIQSIVCFRSFTLTSPSRPLPFTFCYSFRVSSMHATRPHNNLYWFVRPGDIWWRADKREASQCVCILLSLPDFHSVVFHSLFLHAIKCCQQLVGNVAKNSKKACLFPQKIAELIRVLSASYILPSYHT